MPPGANRKAVRAERVGSHHDPWRIGCEQKLDISLVSRSGARRSVGSGRSEAVEREAAAASDKT
jgi:hypothetical protein